MSKKKIIIIVVIVLLIAIGLYMYRQSVLAARNAKFASGNGRLEATEVNISAKLAGRIEQIHVEEGDLVKVGDKLVTMQTNTLTAKLDEAKADKNKFEREAVSAKVQIDVEKSNLEAAKAVEFQKKSLLEAAESTFKRTKSLYEKKVVTEQQLDVDRASFLSAKGAYLAAIASAKQAEAKINAAIADAAAAEAKVKSQIATIATIQADIDDSYLMATRPGRIQYRISEPGEVMSAGGRVLNLVDLTDVYLTFFVPAGVAGKIAIGNDVRIVLDCIPQYPLRAKVSYVASVAQFTPKTVETQSEREKLMFRVKARLDSGILEEYIEYIKTGIPGVAWVKLDPEEPWPEHLKSIIDKGETLPPGPTKK